MGEEGCLAELELAAEGVDEDEGGRSSKQREEMEGQKERVGSGEREGVTATRRAVFIRA